MMSQSPSSERLFIYFLWLQTSRPFLLVAATETNLTLQVPAGTSAHGDAHLICTPTQWTDVAIFLLANYVAHVFTIVSRPGEHTLHLLYRTIIAFLFPYSGIVYSLETISRHAVFVKDPVERAGRARALCVVARSPSWRPCIDDNIRGIRFSGRMIFFNFTTEDLSI